MNIQPEEYNTIAEMISSDDSPVGIDAKKTHIYIIHKLHQLEEKMNEMQKRLDALEG